MGPQCPVLHAEAKDFVVWLGARSACCRYIENLEVHGTNVELKLLEYCLANLESHTGRYC